MTIREKLESALAATSTDERAGALAFLVGFYGCGKKSSDERAARMIIRALEYQLQCRIPRATKEDS